jgi:hypothetical protein
MYLDKNNSVFTKDGSAFNALALGIQETTLEDLD